MTDDPIIEEIHRIREEYAASFNYDIDAIFADLKAKQANSKRKVVRLEPKRISDEKAA
ncbi:MAG: hypothetical protein R3F02_04835 [Thiolinea sp.]